MPEEIESYINSFPEEAQKKLREIRKLLKEVAPDAKESIKWKSPVLEEKHILFAYTGFKDHLNFMPTRSTLDQFKDELKEYKTGRDTIQLPYDKPLPKELIRKIAEHRAWDVRQNNSLWMHNDNK